MSTDGTLSIEIPFISAVNGLTKDDVYIGSRGLHPNDQNFTIDPADSQYFEASPPPMALIKVYLLDIFPIKISGKFLPSILKTTRRSILMCNRLPPLNRQKRLGFNPDKDEIVSRLFINTGSGFRRSKYCKGDY